MNSVPLTVKETIAPTFWRDETLPFIEARSIQGGRQVCYAKHAHDTFSIGAITGGRSTYLNGRVQEHVGAGAVVVINPEDVHACNPIDNQPWSYRMFYVNVSWLMDLQHELGFSHNCGFRAFSTTMTTRPDLYAGLNRLYAVCTDEHADHLKKHSAALTFFSEVQQALSPAPALTGSPNRKLVRAAEYIRENCTRSLKLAEICAAADLSASYLIRSFKDRYGMTPHAYLINCRIEYSRSELRRGRAIADVAIEAGFSDQAHLQRTFRQFVAATPRQYRG
ncbi:helix-turn-helix transcriptional regulator [Cupriavidus malaysiensis]|uniref:AraC family transcriptional regulator n=1 Tax=Cupriavidus malaysiensis TaxID=367825 RepID=A0ABN4TRD6_9BURK|nr:AraC family transcriptional regulator [Cupriavidus malaysiensis]AOZ09618.1 AraC family transcriptional regulator [Cupriavidus malaysiensis]